MCFYGAVIVSVQVSGDAVTFSAHGEVSTAHEHAPPHDQPVPAPALVIANGEVVTVNGPQVLVPPPGPTAHEFVPSEIVPPVAAVAMT